MPNTTPTELDLTFLIDQILKVFIFLQRYPVQRQLFVIAVSILISAIISLICWQTLKRRFPQVKAILISPKKLPLKFVVLFLVRDLSGIVASLIFIHLFQIIFLMKGWKEGLLLITLALLQVYLFYRLVMVGLYTFFPVVTIREYRVRFFEPIFWLFALGTILGLFTNVTQIFQVTIITLFDSPVTLGMIFISTVGLYLWIVGVGILQYLLLDLLMAGTKMDSGSTQAYLILIRYFLIGLGLVIVCGIFGFNSTTLAAISGGLSVGIGFGLKEVFSNFISGIFLLFEGSLRPGDIIQIEGESSEVKKISIRATKVNVLKDNSEKIIPNQAFFTQSITTFTGSDRKVRRSLVVGTSYDCDPQSVINLLLEVVQRHPEVLTDPKPSVAFVNFGESSLDFETTVWLESSVGAKRIISEIGCDIWKTFAEHHIEIPFPQRDLHIRSDAIAEGSGSTSSPTRQRTD